MEIEVKFGESVYGRCVGVISEGLGVSIIEK